jgi:hypothetical protein
VSALPHLSNDYVWSVPAGSDIKIVEKNAGGAGEAIFVSHETAIVIKAKDSAPVIWSLKQLKCAEAAIITKDDAGFHLHVLEMKSKLTQTVWAKALQQLEGMYLSALAVARLVQVTDFVSITCYIAYTEDAMGAQDSADMIMIKTFVGQNNPVGGSEEWISEEMSLPFSTIAAIKKGQRDQNNNVHFGHI